MIKILELFGGIGSPRCALRNIGIPVKAIDYVEIDQKSVRSYNAIFADELGYKTQSVVDWKMQPDVLIHGSPCQDFSLAGKLKGAAVNSGTRSSLMWETIKIIKQMGDWKPKYIIWENVKNIRSKTMIKYHEEYMEELEKLGYTNSFDILDARDFGLPQHRQRVITISSLYGEHFDFSNLIKTPMRHLSEFLSNYDECHIVTQKSNLKKIHQKTNKFKIHVIDLDKYVSTILTTQTGCPNSGVIDIGNGMYRYLTELECWRLQGYTDSDYQAALKANPGSPGKRNAALYKQAGNSIPVPWFESIFRKMFLNQTADNVPVTGTIKEIL